MTAPFKLKHLIPSEDSEAQCLIQWARVMRYEDRRLSDLLIMIPNGADPPRMPPDVNNTDLMLGVVVLGLIGACVLGGIIWTVWF